jgi:hypothetical protein
MPDSTPPRSDEGIICSFMESKPAIESMRIRYRGDSDFTEEEYVSVYGWWRADTEDLVVMPNHPTLDRLHEVEAGLPDERWDRYRAWFTQQSVPPPPVSHAEHFRMVAHASAVQKIRAFAAVLREAERSG